MLPRPHRLRSRDFFRLRARSASSFRGATLSIRVLRLNDRTPAKAGIIIPKKVLAKATARNRVRRRVRAALAELLPKLPLGTRLIVFASASAKGAMSRSLAHEITPLLKQARLLL